MTPGDGMPQLRLARRQAGWGRHRSGAADGERNLGLDVVRALAILLVLIAHYATVIGRWTGIEPPELVLDAGGMGVELFFALSGLLIGRLLIDVAGSEPSARQLLIFLVRRWMRTLPLYYGWLLALCLVIPPRSDFLAHLVQYSTLSQNLAWPMPADSWFGVSWSLTIEEWFYLLFGALSVGAAALIRSRNAVWIAIAAFLVVPPLLRWSLSEPADLDASVGHVVLYRLDAIVWGVVIAELTARKRLPAAGALAMLAAGLALLVALWGGFLDLSPGATRTFWFDLTSIAFALCLPGAQLLRSAWRWFAAVARALSRQSYALYLTHLSILGALDLGYRTRHWFGLPPALTLAVALPFALSWASYRYFERPILARRPPQRARATLAAEPVPQVVAAPAVEAVP